MENDEKKYAKRIIDLPCCDHDAAIAHLILSSSLAAKRRQEQRQKEEEENETQRDEERDLIISIHHIDDISFFVLVECAHLEQREREREMYTARFCFLSLFSFAKERNPTNALLLALRQREEEEARRRHHIVIIVTHSSL